MWWWWLTEIGVLVAIGLLSGAHAACPNACSGHGQCGVSNLCDCFAGWDAGAADCSLRSCPRGPAWADKAVANDVAHRDAECSNAGFCDRGTGLCRCFDGFTDSACQRNACPNDCSGHGICSTIADVALYKGPDYDPIRQRAGDGLGIVYTNWDRNSIQLCECDLGYFGADCSLKICPKGDDPLTINQNFRRIRLDLFSRNAYISGYLGLRFHAITTFINLGNISSRSCSRDLSFQGKFGQVGCLFTFINHKSFRFDLTFFNWPIQSKDNNLFNNNGAPPITEFFCDISYLPSSRTTCTFSDIQSTNLIEYAICSNRGKCNYQTGLCSCLDGFGGPACSNASYLTASASDAVPGSVVNVLSPTFTSSALQINTVKAPAQDFMFLEALANNRRLFAVRGDGMALIDRQTIAGGQTISQGGMNVLNGGVTIATQGLSVSSTSQTVPVVRVETQYQAALGNDYALLELTTASSTPNNHYFIVGKTKTVIRYMVRADGAVFIRGGGLAVTSGVSVHSGGLRVTGGVTVNAGGLTIVSGGLTLTGGATVNSGGLLVLGGQQGFGGHTISSGGLRVVGGVTAASGGLTATGGLTVATAGARITGGLTVNSLGFIVTGGQTVNSGGLQVIGGLTVSSRGIAVLQGVTISSGGLTVNGGASVEANGLLVTGGLTVNSANLVVTTGNVITSTGGLQVANGITISTGGIRATGGISVLMGGLTITGGLTVNTGNVIINTGAQVATGLTIDANGLRVTAGGVESDYVLSSGTVTANGLVTANAGLYVMGGLTVYGGLNSDTALVTPVPSDRRLKKDITPIPHALEKLSQLHGVYFRWLDFRSTKRRQVGVIAQQVQQVLPEAVHNLSTTHRAALADALADASSPSRPGRAHVSQSDVMNDPTTVEADERKPPVASDGQPSPPPDRPSRDKAVPMYLGVDYVSLVPLLIEAIKDLQQIVEIKAEETQKLRDQVLSLADEIKELKQQMKQVLHGPPSLQTATSS